MNAAGDLRSLAHALGGEVSGGQVLAPGPGHSKDDRSLAVRPSADAPGGFVVHSFAGDDALACRDHVRAKAGMGEWRPEPREPSPVEKMAARGRVVATYDYLDAEGEPFLRVLRKEPKGFLQQHWTGSAWAYGKPTAPAIPYRLPDMLAAVHDTVLICEGEKDADALAARGFIATTSPAGAGKWSADLNRWFEGKTVYVLPDNDKAGRDHAELVATNLHGVASEVRIVHLPGLPDKGDVSDYIAANGTAYLTDTCKASPVYEPGQKSNDNAPPKPRGITAAQLQGMRFAPIKYVVEGYLAEGLTLLAGKPKLGKSWLVLDICNAVARGGFTLGDVKCQEGDVLYCALEDNPRRMKSRMAAVCPLTPWPERLTFWHADDMPRLDDGGEAALREWIKAQPNPRLIVIDTLAFARPSKKKDEDSYAYDTRSIRPFKNLADEYGIALVVVHHTRKMAADDALETVSGTNGLTGAADSILVLDRGSEGCTLYGRGRDIAEIETAVEFQKDTCRWRVLGNAAEVRRSDERTAIIEALTPECYTEGECYSLGPREIADVTGQAYSAIRVTLHRMAKKGEVEKAGRGKYRLPNTPPVTSETLKHWGEGSDADM